MWASGATNNQATDAGYNCRNVERVVHCLVLEKEWTYITMAALLKATANRSDRKRLSFSFRSLPSMIESVERLMMMYNSMRNKSGNEETKWKSL